MTTLGECDQNAEMIHCAGDRIAVGCHNGEVLHLQAPWLVDS